MTSSVQPSYSASSCAASSVRPSSGQGLNFLPPRRYLLQKPGAEMNEDDAVGVLPEQVHQAGCAGILAVPGFGGLDRAPLVPSILMCMILLAGLTARTYRFIFGTDGRARMFQGSLPRLPSPLTSSNFSLFSYRMLDYDRGGSVLAHRKEERTGKAGGRDNHGSIGVFHQSQWGAGCRFPTSKKPAR